MKRLLGILVLLILGIFSLQLKSLKGLQNVLATSNISIVKSRQENNSFEVIINNCDLEIFLKCSKFQLVKKSEIADRIIFEGYSELLNKYIVVDNFKINLQLSIQDDFVLIGYPIINGSF